MYSLNLVAFCAKSHKEKTPPDGHQIGKTASGSRQQIPTVRQPVPNQSVGGLGPGCPFCGSNVTNNPKINNLWLKKARNCFSNFAVINFAVISI